MKSDKAIQHKKVRFFQSKDRVGDIQEYFIKQVKQEREVKPLLKPWGW